MGPRLCGQPTSLTPIYLPVALETPLVKEREQEANDLSHVLGPLEEHKSSWDFLPGCLVKLTGLRKEPEFRVDSCSLRRTQRPAGSQKPELRPRQGGFLAGVE